MRVVRETGRAKTPWCTCGTSKGRQVGWTRDQATGVWVCPLCRHPSRLNFEQLELVLAGLDRLTRDVLGLPGDGESVES